MKRILVVDDEELLRNLLRTLFVNEGYEVLEASNGNAALKILGTQSVDLVVTDLVMPDMEGMELITKLRRVHPDVRVIALSGSLHASTGRYLDIARGIGANVTFSKPFDVSKLLAAVGELVTD